MINVTFYYFSKRKNSTALPLAGVTSSVIPVLLKDRCSQLTPVLELESSDPDNYNNYNYVYIPFFSRYYWVKNKEVDTGKRLIIYCEIDVLGSFKNQILSHNAFIKYSQNGNSAIPDNRMATTKDYSISVNSELFPFNIGDYFFLTMTGKYGTCVFTAPKSDIDGLFHNINYDVQYVASGATLTEVANTIIECFTQTLTQGFVENNLKRCYTLPFGYPGTTINKQVYAGQFDTLNHFDSLTGIILTRSVDVNIPWIYTDWRKCSKYTALYLQIPGCGLVEINADAAMNFNTLTFSFTCNFSSGDLCIVVKGKNDERILYETNFNCSADYIVGESSKAINTFMGVTSQFWNAPSTSIKADATEFFSKVIGSGMQGLAEITGGLPTTFSNSGQLGSSLMTYDTTLVSVYCIAKNFSTTIENFATVFGKPLFMYDSLLNYTGFLQCEDFKSHCIATSEENDQISTFLNTGIYIE